MMNTIITKLDEIANDSFYSVNDNFIDLTIDDFDGFDDNGTEIDREFNAAVADVLDWLEANADHVDGDFYRNFYFDNVVVTVGFTSYDI